MIQHARTDRRRNQADSSRTVARPDLGHLVQVLDRLDAAANRSVDSSNTVHDESSMINDFASSRALLTALTQALNHSHRSTDIEHRLHLVSLLARASHYRTEGSRIARVALAECVTSDNKTLVRQMALRALGPLLQQRPDLIPELISTLMENWQKTRPTEVRTLCIQVVRSIATMHTRVMASEMSTQLLNGSSCSQDIALEFLSIVAESISLQPDIASDIMPMLCMQLEPRVPKPIREHVVSELANLIEWVDDDIRTFIIGRLHSVLQIDEDRDVRRSCITGLERIAPLCQQYHGLLNVFRSGVADNDITVQKASIRALRNSSLTTDSPAR